MEIRRAKIEDIPAIQAMADVVFRKTYADIITSDQMDYMIHWMYGTDSLVDQIAGEGKEFFVVTSDGSDAGYVSIEHESLMSDGRPLWHLQKIYVMPQWQGSGLGRQMFEFVCQHLREKHPDGCRVELNVNRENKAVHFYERMGMHRDRQGDFPIGNGYYMNDYIYALDL